ncbi:hypothetical protein CF67_15013 (plasmid) [Candidatus Photodesmus blepharus]|uniref:Uncharacterized protein n=1 Tax=Candidatus Photodesmus blepharonis TaxID=1179155 RepID=A0A084CNW8_9GAMM|nr:hypothetical protein [Candidatus Photodesmus blepharus]KEY91497.1 hypothetical protein CF67_15013 [Candidatus Photodesmus blepharus]
MELSYNERLRKEFRTLVIAFFNAVEKSKEDYELSTHLLHEMALKKGLTEKQEMTSDWLKNRVYQHKKYKHLPKWIGLASYYCLLEVEGWEPSKNGEWFAMISLFVKENREGNLDYSKLTKMLPRALEGELGFKWLHTCLNDIKNVQRNRITKKTKSKKELNSNKIGNIRDFKSYTNLLEEVSMLPKHGICLQIMIFLNWCHCGLSSKEMEIEVDNGYPFVESVSIIKYMLSVKKQMNSVKDFSALQDAKFIEKIVVSSDSGKIISGDRYNRNSVSIYYRLSDKGMKLFSLV